MQKSLTLKVSWSSSHQTSTECPGVPPRYLAIHTPVSPAGDLTGPAAPQGSPKARLELWSPGLKCPWAQWGEGGSWAQEDPAALQVHVPQPDTAFPLPGTCSQLPPLLPGITVMHSYSSCSQRSPGTATLTATTLPPKPPPLFNTQPCSSTPLLAVIYSLFKLLHQRVFKLFIPLRSETSEKHE